MTQNIDFKKYNKIAQQGVIALLDPDMDPVKKDNLAHYLRENIEELCKLAHIRNTQDERRIQDARRTIERLATAGSLDRPVSW